MARRLSKRHQGKVKLSYEEERLELLRDDVINRKRFHTLLQETENKRVKLMAQAKTELSKHKLQSPKGKTKANYDDHRLEILREDMENRKQFYDFMQESEAKKVKLLETLVAKFCRK